MKKRLTFIATAMAAAATMTAASPAQQNQTPVGRPEAPACLHKAITKDARQKAPERIAEGWKFDVSADQIIYDQPAGELRMYSKACDYYGYTLWGAMQGSSDGMPCKIVEAADGAFYIYNPFSAVDTKTWLKAEIDGERMTIKMPQAIYADSEGENDYVYVAQMCHFEWDDDGHEQGKYYSEEGETEIVFNKEGDTWVMQPWEEVNEHPMIMGLVSADDGAWCVYSDWNIRHTPFTEPTVELPASVEPEEWIMNYAVDVDAQNICGNFIRLALDGNDVYLSGISSMFPEAWIKGTLSEGKMEFPSGQYLGADEMSNAFGYFFGLSEERKYNEEWDYWYSEYKNEPSLVFEKDEATGNYTTALTLGIMKGKNMTSFIDYYNTPILSEKTEITDFTPMNPILNYYSAPGDWAGSLYFDFPILNIDGQLLDTANLYYRVFVDGEVFEFYSDEYEGVEDGTTEIPFDFTNEASIGSYGTCNVTHFFSISFFDYETIGIQTFYRDGEKEYASDIVQMVGPDVSVDSLNADRKPVAETWYDLSGRRVANPANGIYIRRIEYSDGSTRSLKTVLK